MIITRKRKKENIRWLIRSRIFPCICCDLGVCVWGGGERKGHLFLESSSGTRRWRPEGKLSKNTSLCFKNYKLWNSRAWRYKRTRNIEWINQICTTDQDVSTSHLRLLYPAKVSHYDRVERYGLLSAPGGNLWTWETWRFFLVSDPWNRKMISVDVEGSVRTRAYATMRSEESRKTCTWRSVFQYDPRSVFVV